MNNQRKYHIVKITKTIVTEEEFCSVFNAERRAFEINDNISTKKGLTETAEVITIEQQKKNN